MFVGFQVGIYFSLRGGEYALICRGNGGVMSFGFDDGALGTMRRSLGDDG